MGNFSLVIVEGYGEVDQIHLHLDLTTITNQQIFTNLLYFYSINQHASLIIFLRSSIFSCLLTLAVLLWLLALGYYSKVNIIAIFSILMQLEGEGGGSCFLQWLQTSYLAPITRIITIPGCLSPQDIEVVFFSWQIAVPGEGLEEGGHFVLREGLLILEGGRLSLCIFYLELLFEVEEVDIVLLADLGGRIFVDGGDTADL